MCLQALIVKVFGRAVGYSYLAFKINALWKPVAKLECVDLGRDFFLIRFGCVDNYDKVLKEGPWFIGGHFLAIRPWEPYFKVSEAKLSFVAVWIRLPELHIDFYDRSVLKEIGSAIGPVLCIDNYTASGSKGNYARLCVQVDLEKPLINLMRFGKCRQSVLYEGISVLCFSCGRLGHTQDKCCYSIKQSERSGENGEVPKVQEASQESQPYPNYGPWMLLTRKRNLVRNRRRSTQGKGTLGSEGQKGKIKLQVVEDDVTSKSTFGVLEADLSDLACEDRTIQAQGIGVVGVEHDTLIFQACREDPMTHIQHKHLETSPKTVL